MENIFLVGSEDVQRAGHNMTSAASDMLRAANLINETMYSFQQQIDRLEGLLERAINELPQGEA